MKKKRKPPLTEQEKIAKANALWAKKSQREIRNNAPTLRHYWRGGISPPTPQ